MLYCVSRPLVCFKRNFICFPGRDSSLVSWSPSSTPRVLDEPVCVYAGAAFVLLVLWPVLGASRSKGPES